MTQKPALTRVQKTLIAFAVAGGLVVAGIGFAGSYAAVSSLAEAKHFGGFARWFPIGIDAGIAVLLSIDLLLAGFRMRFAPLRPFAWFLTVATICFNASSAGADWIAVGMHAVIPLLFVVIIEATRFAVSRIADITADRHMESPPIIRWILAPTSTFRIWRRMRLWQLASYQLVIDRERDARVFRARLKRRYGRRWRSAASELEQLALELSQYGVPIRETLASPSAVALPEVATVAVAETPSERLSDTADGAPESAPAPAMETPQERPAYPLQSATADAMQSAPDATNNATEGVYVAPLRRPESAASAATKAPRKALPKPPSERPKKDIRGAARDAIKALYGEHGRRPLESEMIAALKKAKLPHSRQFANARRLEIEKEHPELAAMGSTNVHPLTGTDS